METCRTKWTDETVWLMERIWELPGSYANWKITLTADPAPGARDWPVDSVDRVGEFFTDMVNLLECQRLLDDHSGDRGTIVR